MALASGGAPFNPTLAATAPTASAAGVDSDGDGLLDTFEVLYALDPNKRDSDGNGLLDPAEDLDHDGLSNLGEQTFGTNPWHRDTDRNGVPDGMDDANLDGVADGLEQDHRRIPQPLVPVLTDAQRDDACYRTGFGSTGNCVGDPLGTTHIAIYGDSHAGQWIPALNSYAEEHHWRLSG